MSDCRRNWIEWTLYTHHAIMQILAFFTFFRKSIFYFFTSFYFVVFVNLVLLLFIVGGSFSWSRYCICCYCGRWWWYKPYTKVAGISSSLIHTVLVSFLICIKFSFVVFCAFLGFFKIQECTGKIAYWLK